MKGQFQRNRSRGFVRGGIDELRDVSAEIIAEITGVHITTARRWKRGEMPPLSALKVVALHQTGELGTVDLKWNGWKLRDGKLISDDGTCFTPGEVRSLPFLRMQIQSYQLDQRLVRQADWVSETWSPAPEQPPELAVG